MIGREHLERHVRSALRRSRVVMLLGPRQCGKTTMARKFVAADSINYFDLEDPSSLSRLDEPMLALRSLKGLIVIDEVQRKPDLFPVLRVLSDRTVLPARFLILGSASPELLRQSSESLAGRIETVAMSGFSMAEVGSGAHSRHWLRGGFPPAFLSRTEADSLAEEFCTDFSGAGPAAMGHWNTLCCVIALLEHAGALSRPDMECN